MFDNYLKVTNISVSFIYLTPYQSNPGPIKDH